MWIIVSVWQKKKITSCPKLSINYNLLSQLGTGFSLNMKVMTDSFCVGLLNKDILTCKIRKSTGVNYKNNHLTQNPGIMHTERHYDTVHANNCVFTAMANLMKKSLL